MLKIYNTYTQKKEIFKSLHPTHIKIYVCGPTVYDYAHIGNGRTYAAFDVIIRYLKWRGFNVIYVRNITDIDDKIIKRAEDHQESFQAVVTRYTKAIQEDFKALGLLLPTHEPRATEFIPNIIQCIQTLIDKNFAYIATNGDIYYDVRQFAPYGSLSHHQIDQLESGARVEINHVKKDPLDFVLWKLAKPKEPSWDSPWGAGRPGWHIECSAMSMSLLGVHFDIHGGGRDLIFPHHENEIAQSKAISQEQFVNYWLHTGYLQIEKEKMSKSLGNFFTIRELLQKHRAECLRYFLISSHYRSSLQFSETGLTQALSALTRLYTALRDIPVVSAIKDSPFEQQFIKAMDDDFNTPVAFSVLFELAHEIHRLKTINPQAAATHAALLKSLGGVVGLLQEDPLNFLQKPTGTLDIEKIEALIESRNLARQNKNWAEADRIREELLNLSIVLEDSAIGTTWKFTE